MGASSRTPQIDSPTMTGTPMIDSIGAPDVRGGTVIMSTYQALAGNRELKVLEEDVQPREAAGFALVLFCLLDAAETDEGAAAGFFGRHSVADVFVDGEIEMRLKFCVEVGVELLLVKEGQDAIEGFASGCH